MPFSINVTRIVVLKLGYCILANVNLNQPLLLSLYLQRDAPEEMSTAARENSHEQRKVRLLSPTSLV